MQGGKILSGLKRPANGELVAGSGKQGEDGSAAARIAALLISATVLARRSLRWLAGRAVDRAITPGSLAGISVLLAVCAAAWFSGGAGDDGARGLLAMLGSLLFLTAGRGLAAFIVRRPGYGQAPAAAGSDGGTDWLVLPALTSAGASAGASVGDGAAGTGADVAAAASTIDMGNTLGFGWLAPVCAVAAECAIYGGMAAGSAPATMIGPWPLAVVTISAVLITELLGACRSAALTEERSQERNPVLRSAGTLLRVPPGLRGLLALVTYAFGGPQAALLAVLALAAVAVAAAIATLGMVTPPGSTGSGSTGSGSTGSGGTGPGGPAKRASGSARTGPATAARITALVGVAGSPGLTTAVRLTTGQAGAGAASGATGGQAGYPRAAGGTGASQPGAPAARGREIILALRDDGAAARWAGRLVQGNLIPLPPALAGLIATALLAALGLRHLPGFIALTPPVVMMLAAPGSSHPHDGRFDWTVPVLLAAVQLVYLGSLGFALGLPQPVVFSACALVVIWYTSQVASVPEPAAATAGCAGRQAGTGEDEAEDVEQAQVATWGGGLGWETRLFVVGLAATFGLATFGYVGLAAYLGVLICRKVVTGYLVPREEDRQ